MTAKTILYVEDNEVNRRLVQDLLSLTSYRLLEAPVLHRSGSRARGESATPTEPAASKSVPASA